MGKVTYTPITALDGWSICAVPVIVLGIKFLNVITCFIVLFQLPLSSAQVTDEQSSLVIAHRYIGPLLSRPRFCCI